MNRSQLESYISEEYGAEPDYPWAKDPDYAVFRHANNKKWFALIMRVPKTRLGLTEEGALDIVNFKCAPAVIGSLRAERGFFPAYHMSKEHWITAALDGSADDAKIKLALDMSYAATAVKPRRRRED